MVSLGVRRAQRAFGIGVDLGVERLHVGGGEAQPAGSLPLLREPADAPGTVRRGVGGVGGSRPPAAAARQSILLVTFAALAALAALDVQQICP